MAARERLEELLQLPDADILAGKEGREGGEIGLAVVVRDEDLGGDGLGSGDALVHSHRKGLVHREEGDVNVFQVRHLGDVFGVAGDVDAETVDGEDITVAVALGMEHFATGRGVVGRDRIHDDTTRKFGPLPVRDGLALADLGAAGLIEDQPGTLRGEDVDGDGLEMVLVLVRHQDDIGLGELHRVVRMLAVLAHRVDLDGQAIVCNFQRAMLDEGDPHGFAAVGPEGFHLIFRDALSSLGPAQEAAPEVIDGESRFLEGGRGRRTPLAAPAVCQHRTGGIQRRLCQVDEAVTLPVDVQGAGKMILCKFVGRTDVHELDGRILGKHLVEIGHREVGVALAGEKAQEGKGHEGVD